MCDQVRSALDLVTESHIKHVFDHLDEEDELSELPGDGEGQAGKTSNHEDGAVYNHKAQNHVNSDGRDGMANLVRNRRAS